MFRPMLACSIDPEKLSHMSYIRALRFPYLASPKRDGVRCELTEDDVLCRSLERVPNYHIRATLGHLGLVGVEGELTVGPPTAPGVYNTTESAVMSRSGVPDFKLYLFDDFAHGLCGASRRYDFMIEQVERKGLSSKHIGIVQDNVVHSLDDLLDFERRMLAIGFEGICLRQVDSLYKHGRSTLREGGLLRLVREGTAEAVIIDVNERLINNNEQTTSALGYAKRSTHKANKAGAGEVGSFWVKSSKWPQPFKVAAGKLTRDDRKWLWENRSSFKGRTIVFVYKPHGEKNVPRQARFKGWRTRRDL
jgi:DNA ligase-1